MIGLSDERAATVLVGKANGGRLFGMMSSHHTLFIVVNFVKPSLLAYTHGFICVIAPSF